MLYCGWTVHSRNKLYYFRKTEAITCTWRQCIDLYIYNNREKTHWCIKRTHKKLFFYRSQTCVWCIVCVWCVFRKTSGSFQQPDLHPLIQFALSATELPFILGCVSYPEVVETTGISDFFQHKLKKQKDSVINFCFLVVFAHVLVDPNSKSFLFIYLYFPSSSSLISFLSYIRYCVLFNCNVLLLT